MYTELQVAALNDAAEHYKRILAGPYDVALVLKAIERAHDVGLTHEDVAHHVCETLPRDVTDRDSLATLHVGFTRLYQVMAQIERRASERFARRMD